MKKILSIFFTMVLIGIMYRSSPFYIQETKPVLLFKPEQSDVQDMIMLQGKVVVQSSVRIYAETTSIIEKIYVAAGDTVTVGQPLVRLNSSPSTAPDAAAAAALAQLSDVLTSGNIQELEAFANRFTSQQTSSTGQNVNEVYQLYSPVAGTVMSISCSEGDPVNTLFPCITIYEPNKLILEAEVDEASIGCLKTGMPCQISVPAFGYRDIAASVSAITPYAKQSILPLGSSSPKTTVQFIPENSISLSPGYRADICVIAAHRPDAVLIPYTALLQDEQQNEYVLIVQSSKIVKRIVTTGSELGTQTEIVSGLSTDEVLLLEPSAELEGKRIAYVQD